jgi:hypothetical protein
MPRQLKPREWRRWRGRGQGAPTPGKRRVGGGAGGGGMNQKGLVDFKLSGHHCDRCVKVFLFGGSF